MAKLGNLSKLFLSQKYLHPASERRETKGFFGIAREELAGVGHDLLSTHFGLLGHAISKEIRKKVEPPKLHREGEIKPNTGLGQKAEFHVQVSEGVGKLERTVAEGLKRATEAVHELGKRVRSLRGEGEAGGAVAPVVAPGSGRRAKAPDEEGGGGFGMTPLGGIWPRAGLLSGLLYMMSTMAALVQLGATTTPEEDKTLAEGDAKNRALRKKYGDETLRAARKKYMPWWKWKGSLDSTDEDDEEYIRKYLKDKREHKKESFQLEATERMSFSADKITFKKRASPTETGSSGSGGGDDNISNAIAPPAPQSAPGSGDFSGNLSPGEAGSIAPPSSGSGSAGPGTVLPNQGPSGQGTGPTRGGGVSGAPEGPQGMSYPVDPNDPIGQLQNQPQGYQRERGQGGEFNYALSPEGRKEFGDPYQGSLASQGKIVSIKTDSGKTVQVNAATAERFRGFLNELEARGYKINDISGYSHRQNVNNPGALSTHATGTTMDINPGRNPNRGSTTDLPPNVNELAAKWGLSWGRKFGDPMHFETMSPALRQKRIDDLVSRGFLSKGEGDYIKEHGLPQPMRPPEPPKVITPDDARASDFKSLSGPNNPFFSHPDAAKESINAPPPTRPDLTPPSDSSTESDEAPRSQQRRPASRSEGSLPGDSDNGASAAGSVSFSDQAGTSPGTGY